MSDHTRPLDDREGLRKEAEGRAEQKDANIRGEPEAGEPTPGQARAAKGSPAKRHEVAGSAIVACFKGGEQLEFGDPELLRWLKEAMRYKRPRARDDDPGNQ